MVFAVAAGAGLFGNRWARKRERAPTAFRCSVRCLYGMMGCVAAGLYPSALPARDPAYSLTAAVAAAPAFGLRQAFYWWIPGILIARAYFWFLYSTMPRRFSIDDEADH